MSLLLASSASTAKTHVWQEGAVFLGIVQHVGLDPFQVGDWGLFGDLGWVISGCGSASQSGSMRLAA
ncbi:hypothetical protein [Salibaculum sp.]|uniref:hypothetical protein n=1 Tax=Salibaculum sp. TaxID=2855480 RepID=UPI002B45BB36|nr:hypothetical protein [Salibaculum sp.]HKL68812.1 hypothetical protein [Salibaculum sp.]